MSTIWLAQSNAGNINDAGKFKDGSGNTLTWPPAADDTLCANGKTSITINVNVTCAEISTKAQGGGSAGGGFVLSSGVTITANLTAGTSTCVAPSGTGYTLTLVGNSTGGSSTNKHGLSITSAVTLAMTGNAIGGTYSTAAGVNCTAGTISLTGNATGATGPGLKTSVDATVSGTASGGSGNNSGYGITMSATANVTCNAVIGGAGAEGVYSTSAGTLTVTTDITGGSGDGIAGVLIGASGSVACLLAYAGNLWHGAGVNCPPIKLVANMLVTLKATVSNCYLSGSYPTLPAAGDILYAAETTYGYTEAPITPTLTLPAENKVYADGAPWGQGGTGSRGTLRASNIGTLAGTSDLTATRLAYGVTVDDVIGTALLDAQSVVDAIQSVAPTGKTVAIGARLPDAAAGSAGGVPIALTSGAVTVGAYATGQDPLTLITGGAYQIAVSEDGYVTYANTAAPTAIEIADAVLDRPSSEAGSNMFPIPADFVPGVSLRDMIQTYEQIVGR